jgi:hypothetical protein
VPKSNLEKIDAIFSPADRRKPLKISAIRADFRLLRKDRQVWFSAGEKIGGRAFKNRRFQKAPRRFEECFAIPPA